MLAHVRARASLESALGPYEALDRAPQHEEVGLSIGSVVLDDLLGRNPGPCIVQPSVPAIVGMSAAGLFDLEPCRHHVGRTAAVQRFGIAPAVRMSVVGGRV